MGEGAALDELGDYVGLAVELAVVEDGEDVRMAEPRDGDRLAAKALFEFGILREHVREDLDRDHPLERMVVRLEDGRHAAPADLLHDLVRPDADAGGDFHPAKDDGRGGSAQHLGRYE